MDAEIWKDIPNLEGYYQASNLGRIKSLPRICLKKHKGKVVEKPVRERILRAGVGSHGYYIVQLYGSQIKRCTVQELILSTFVGPRPVKHVAMHLNDNKLDNRLENLKWATYSENTLAAFKTGRQKPRSLGQHGKNNILSKPVLQLDKKQNIIEEFESMKDAHGKTGIDFRQISRACKQTYRTAGGYYWRLSA